MSEQTPGTIAPDRPEHAETHPIAEPVLQREGPSLATAALVGVGLAIFEPELIPGMLIGAGVFLAPKLLPALGNALRPAVKGLVKAGMSVRESMAEAGEHFEDIVAEVRAETGEPGDGSHLAPEPETAAGPSRRPRRGHSPSPAQP